MMPRSAQSSLSHCTTLRPGMAAGIFGSLGERGINVELITAAAGGHGKSDVAFVVRAGDLERALEQAEILKEEFQAESLLHNPNVAIVAIRDRR